MDRSTGALVCERRLAHGAVQSPKDLLSAFTLDARGLITDVKLYGGDLDPIGVGQAAPCGTSLGAPAYWRHMTYTNDVLRTVRPKRSNGVDGPFLIYDVDIDPSTGLVTTMRSPAGYVTSQSFDVLGRVTDIVPQDGASTHITYTPATGAAPADVRTVRRAWGGGSVLTQTETVMDAFGRQQLMRTMMPGGTWSEQETTYNARGWVLSASEQGDTNKRTLWLGYDPFGRPGILRPTDGASHDITWSYLGNRKTTVLTRIATGANGAESTVAMSQEMDSHGRLRRVSEPSGPNGSTSATSYGYDVSGQLTRISSGPQSQHQFRLFTYDNRGYLLNENHPETGNIVYRDYDAAGLLHRRDDGENDQGFVYDFMGRMLEVRDKNHGNRLVKQLFYDNGGGFGMGRLWQTIRHNHVDMPWTPATNDNVRVTQQYTFSGIGGAVSQHDTLFTWPDLTYERFRQLITYDDLGNVKQRLYPRLMHGPGDTTATTSQTVHFNHDQGRLSGIPGWINSVLYHDSGLLRRIHHSNGVLLWQDHHADHHGRPGRIRTTGASPLINNFDTGSFAYDGAGNVASMGNDVFRYDGVSRLVEATLFDSLVNQTYAYDRFGNMTERITDGSVETFPIDSGTNRLTDGTYDGAGNLTQRQGHFWSYDSQNRVVGQAWMRYLYDASDERVASVPNTPQRTVIYHIRDQNNRRTSQLTRASGVISRDRDWVYGAGRLPRLVDAVGQPLPLLCRPPRHAAPDHRRRRQRRCQPVPAALRRGIRWTHRPRQRQAHRPRARCVVRYGLHARAPLLLLDRPLPERRSDARHLQRPALPQPLRLCAWQPPSLLRSGRPDLPTVLPYHLALPHHLRRHHHGDRSSAWSRHQPAGDGPHSRRRLLHPRRRLCHERPGPSRPDAGRTRQQRR